RDRKISDARAEKIVDGLLRGLLRDPSPDFSEFALDGAGGAAEYPRDQASGTHRAFLDELEVWIQRDLRARVRLVGLKPWSQPITELHRGRGNGPGAARIRLPDVRDHRRGDQ